jgi:hypothetical protein
VQTVHYTKVGIVKVSDKIRLLPTTNVHYGGYMQYVLI